MFLFCGTTDDISTLILNPYILKWEEIILSVRTIHQFHKLGNKGERSMEFESFHSGHSIFWILRDSNDTFDPISLGRTTLLVSFPQIFEPKFVIIDSKMNFAGCKLFYINILCVEISNDSFFGS